jgi:hypothetical protein
VFLQYNRFLGKFILEEQTRLKWEERNAEMFVEDFVSFFTGASRFSETPFQYLKIKQFMIDLIQNKNM